MPWLPADICMAHNALLDPEARFAALPASQRWALDVLRSPDAPAGEEYDEADQALSVGRNNLVRRELSELRRAYEGGGMSVTGLLPAGSSRSSSGSACARWKHPKRRSQ